MTGGFSKYKSAISPALAGLIGVNALLFIALAIINLSSPNGGTIISDAVCLPDSIAALCRRPWTILTYAFAQANFIQFAFNMLWLYCFGKLILMRCSGAKLVTIYICGAIAGGMLFVLSYDYIVTSHSYHAAVLMGASASVIAIAVTTAIIMPDTELYMPAIGPVKVKWIVIVAILLFSIGLTAANAGGNLAHIGGAAAGAWFGLAERNKLRVKSKSGETEYTKLMAKIRQSGYASLTKNEKRRFFELSRKN